MFDANISKYFSKLGVALNKSFTRYAVGAISAHTKLLVMSLKQQKKILIRPKEVLTICYVTIISK
jgi:hypothetical protein